MHELHPDAAGKAPADRSWVLRQEGEGLSKKEDEEHDCRIITQVDEFFNQFHKKAWDGDEEDVKPYTDNDLKAGPSGAIKIGSDDDDDWDMLRIIVTALMVMRGVVCL